MPIKLTPTETELAEWAIDPMEDYGEELEEDEPGEGWGPEEVPVLRGDQLDISASPPRVVEDMLERIEYQYPDMLHDAEFYFIIEYEKQGMSDARARSAARARVRRQSKAIDTLAQKLRDAMPQENPSYDPEAALEEVWDKINKLQANLPKAVDLAEDIQRMLDDGDEDVDDLFDEIDELLDVD